MFKIIFVLLASAWAASAGPVTFLLNSPDIAGAPGDRIGWGFTMTINDGTSWVSVGSSTFVQTGGSLVGNASDPDILTPFDVIGNNGGFGATYTGFTGPAESPWAQSFSYTSGTPFVAAGVHAFQVCQASDILCGFTPVAGALETGTLSIVYQVYSGDPTDPTTTSSSVTDNFDVTITVTPAAPTGVPEPSSEALAGLGVAILCLAARRARA